MTDLFFYGTLRHLPLLAIVLDRPIEALEFAYGRAQDHAVYLARGEAFPFIRAEAGAEAPGLVVSGLSDEDIARLNFYEGFFEFALTDLTIALEAGGTCTAQVYLPQPDAFAPGPAFDLEAWVADWAPLADRAAREYMAFFGTDQAEEADPLYNFFLARAGANLRARRPAPTQLRRSMQAHDVQITPRPGGARSFFRFDRFEICHRRFDGSMSARIGREAFVAFDAALVLPYDPVQDTVLLIEQLRYGPILRHDPQPSVLEPIAGLIDAGETPEDSARREAQEEAGLTLETLRPMYQGYASPGYSSEYFYCFLAVTSLDPGRAGLGGLESENEDIRSHVISFDRAMALIDSGEINAVPLATMLLWLARQREALRAGA